MSEIQRNHNCLQMELMGMECFFNIQGTNFTPMIKTTHITVLINLLAGGILITIQAATKLNLLQIYSIQMECQMLGSLTGVEIQTFL